MSNPTTTAPATGELTEDILGLTADERLFALCWLRFTAPGQLADAVKQARAETAGSAR